MIREDFGNGVYIIWKIPVEPTNTGSTFVTSRRKHAL